MMEKRGPEFYDDEKVFETYNRHRTNSNTPNETMEQPYLWRAIGDPRGLNVLDLGCGDARIAKKFQTMGAASYFGIEGSHRMVEQAKANIQTDFSQVQHCWLEDFEASSESFDLTISSLAFHYIEDLPLLLRKVHRALKLGGRLVFSVEHPLITSCNISLETSPVRQAWIVDNYFARGPRKVQWMGDTVIKYHRTLEDFLNMIRDNGFQLQTLNESDPDPVHFQDQNLLQRRKRIPLFLIIAAQKN